jgi:hypothetical protein
VADCNVVLGRSVAPKGNNNHLIKNSYADQSDPEKGVHMKIGIIGAGFVARAVAAVATKHGHEIMVSNTRGAETLFSLTGSTGCKAGSPQEAAEFGDIVLVAIPLKAYQTIPVAPLEGKIVLDGNNYYPARDGHIGELDRDHDERTSGPPPAQIEGRQGV